MSVNHYCYSAQ